MSAKDSTPLSTTPGIRVSRALMPGYLPIGLAYALAAVVTLATLAAHQIISSGSDQKSFSLFLLPIILSAYIGGLGSGLFATLLVALLTDYVLLPPLGALLIDSKPEAVRWITMIIAGTLCSVLSEGLHRARRNAEASRQLYAVTLSSIGDAVITTDTRGWVTFMNKEAMRLTGWTDLAIGQPLDAIFRIVNEHTHIPAASPIARVLQTGRVVGLANHTVLISRDGRETPIDDSGAPITNGHGTVLGVVLVFRDVTEQRRAEEALRESESRFRQMTESLPQLVWTATPTGECDYLSQQWVDYTGIPDAELRGHGWMQQIHPDDRERAIAAWEAAQQTDTNAQVECRLRRHDGAYRWFDTHALRLRDASGATVKWFGSNIDIDNQKQINADLQRSERTLKLFVEMAPAAIAMFDKNMRYLAVSRRFITDYRVEGQELIGRSHYDVFPEIPEHWKEIHCRCLAGAVEKAEDDPFPRLDGTMDWIRWELHPWYEDAAHIGGVVLFSEVITARKQAETALRESEARFHYALDSMLEGCQIIGFDWRYLYLNDSILRHSRLPRADMIGRTMTEVFPGIVDTELFAMLQRCMQDRVSQRIENLFTYLDGSSAWYDLSVQPSPEGLFILSIDISDRKQAEADLQLERAQLAERVAERTVDLRRANAELARATRLKDEFLANMSHELRTPLTAILGRTELLQESIYGPLTSRQVESLSSIDASSRHLLSLINDILDLSKIEAGKIEILPMPIIVESLCQASLQMVTQAALTRRISVNIVYDSQVSIIYGDERRLKQILVNLLTNAVKFTTEGGAVGLEVCGNAQAQTVSFTVWDTGIGIAADQIAKLFQPFVQIDHGLNREYEGTGLGLSLVQRLAEAHGGSVEVESTLGEGSRFRVSLPWASALANGDAAPLLDAAMATELGAPLLQRALVIEDSRLAAEQIARYLNEFGAQVEIYPWAQGAVDRAVSLQPDVIVLDILLPDQPGWDVLRLLKADPRTQALPVLVVSVVDEPAYGRSLGAAAYLIKPIDRASLAEALRAALTSPSPEPSPKALLILPKQGDSRPRVLLAEDNEDNSQVVEEYLHAHGYAVSVARNGFEVLMRLEEILPVIVLMDIQMPGMDGLEAIRRMRARPHLAAVPVIALTALAMPGDRDRCLAAGANDYLPKPVSLSLLLETIKAHLRE